MTAVFSDLQDKRIFISGATRGIGLACAELLATQGAHILFNYREGNIDKANQLSARLLELGASGVRSVLFDLTDTEQMTSAIKTLTEEGPIAGLVNNAGISRDSLLLRLKESDVDQIISTNLKGAIMLTQALSRNFLKAQEVSIVNVSSIVGLMGNSAQAAYAASKAGLIGLTKSVAKELGSKNIRCNAICPGFIETDMTEALDEKVKEVYLGSIPLRRFGNAKEVAELVCFLLSNSSSYISGEVIKIDGGLYT